MTDPAHQLERLYRLRDLLRARIDREAELFREEIERYEQLAGEGDDDAED